MTRLATTASVDAALLLSAQRVLDRHRVCVPEIGRAACEYCHEVWPCPSALSAQQAVVMAGGPYVPLTTYERPDGAAAARVPRPRTSGG